jgi:hypothetical protein
LVFPTGHVQEQLPTAQMHPGAHAAPHPPQFAGSVARLAQKGQPVDGSVHAVMPEEHPRMHTPAEHTEPTQHFLPHAPQFSGSVRRSVQLPEHAVAPASQVGVMSDAAVSAVSSSAVSSGAVSSGALSTGGTSVPASNLRVSSPVASGIDVSGAAASDEAPGPSSTLPPHAASRADSMHVRSLEGMPRLTRIRRVLSERPRAQR